MSLNGQIGTSSKKLGESVDTLSNSFLNGVSSVNQAGDALVEGVKQANGNTLSQSLKESASSRLATSKKQEIPSKAPYQQALKNYLRRSTNRQMFYLLHSKRLAARFSRPRSLKTGNGNQQKNIETLNKNLVTLNSIYELQFKKQTASKEF